MNPMNTSSKKLLDGMIVDGRLALAANLLFDIVTIGWVAFFGLYALEVLLPTFIIARLSLVKFALMLLILTSLLLWLGRALGREAPPKEKRTSRSLAVFIGMAGLAVIALAHYRFPWWSIPISLSGYAAILWLFKEQAEMKR